MKIRIVAAVLTVAFLFAAIITIGTVTAYAKVEQQEPESPAQVERPFTPAGTGTVLDNATNEDGKEFFTVMSANGNIFYLIIDRQRDRENVYFLNTVTERDLLALAEQSGDIWEPEPQIILVPLPEPEPAPEPNPEPEPERSNMSGVLLLIFMILGGGAAGWYFIIYRPQQQEANTAEALDYADEAYSYEDDISPWDMEEVEEESDSHERE